MQLVVGLANLLAPLPKLSIIATDDMLFLVTRPTFLRPLSSHATVSNHTRIA